MKTGTNGAATLSRMIRGTKASGARGNMTRALLAEKGQGLAILRNTTINILGVPILWLPWMAYPLGTERESGFLFPEFGYGNRNGAEVGLPYFWAADWRKL